MDLSLKESIEDHVKGYLSMKSLASDTNQHIDFLYGTTKSPKENLILLLKIRSNNLESNAHEILVNSQS